jgi:O-antigen/teichoic acid export membrane protein
MNSKTISFIKNFSYTLTSNFVTLLVSTLVILVVPKLIGVEEYGYWQVYLFYSSYIGFLHLGWNDGIYLRYGGKEYYKLDKKVFFSQFYMLVSIQIIIALLLIFFTWFLTKDVNRLFIFQIIALGILIVNVRSMLIYILQATNRIKEYAQITMMDRLLYLCLIFFIIVVGIMNLKLLILTDLIGKTVSLTYAMYLCRDIILQKVSVFYFSFREAIENISVGIKLMFANIASMLIIGVVRFGIERSWDVSTFGKVSLTLSIANLLLLFINALGIIMFPILRRTDEKNLPSIYVTMRDFLMVVLFGTLVVYYPLKVFMFVWLPTYSDGLIYMALLFPICIYEGKMALLINTYLKTLRKEKLILKINLVLLVFSLMITFITTIILKNLDLAVLSVVILLALRCILAEVLLSKMLGISMYKDIALEIVMTLIFILTGWFINSWLASLVYVVAYLIYLTIKRKDIISTTKNVRILMKAQ